MNVEVSLKDVRARHVFTYRYFFETMVANVLNVLGLGKKTTYKRCLTLHLIIIILSIISGDERQNHSRFSLFF